jgi:hypothetical protein
MHLSMVQDIECCAIQLDPRFFNIYVLFIYVAQTGDFEQFSTHCWMLEISMVVVADGR